MGVRAPVGLAWRMTWTSSRSKGKRSEAKELLLRISMAGLQGYCLITRSSEGDMYGGVAAW